jgi:hypothetical protein
MVSLLGDTDSRSSNRVPVQGEVSVTEKDLWLSREKMCELGNVVIFTLTDSYILFNNWRKIFCKHLLSILVTID